MSELHTDYALQAAANEFKSVIEVGHKLAHYQLEPANGAAALVADYQAGVAAYILALNETVKYLKETKANPGSHSDEQDMRIADLHISWNGNRPLRSPSRLSLLHKGPGLAGPECLEEPQIQGIRRLVGRHAGCLLAFNQQHGEAVSQASCPGLVSEGWCRLFYPVSSDPDLPASRSGITDRSEVLGARSA